MASKYTLLSSLAQKGITDKRVLDAIKALSREQFIPFQYAKEAYKDIPLPINCNQTISQPYIIAQMTQTLLARGSVKKVLEVGTGSGYQAAILGQLVDVVYTVERIHHLYLEAKARLRDLKYTNIHVFYQDGFEGLPQFAPFDAIIVTAVAKEVPPLLLKQLSQKGRLVIPVGCGTNQALKCIDREGDGFVTQLIEPVRFVPMLKGTE